MPTSSSGRIIVGAFLISSVCIVASYTSNLVAFLAVTTVEFPFNTLEEMVKQDEFDWAVVDGASLYSHLNVCITSRMEVPLQKYHSNTTEWY